MDNQLEFINSIEQKQIDKMTLIRKKYIALDKEIMDFIFDIGSLDSMENNQKNNSARRTIALARTHLEISLQFAIKSLCIIGEIKE